MARSAGAKRNSASWHAPYSRSQRRNSVFANCTTTGVGAPERLARDARVEGAAMRKRLQRVRDKLRGEIEMDEQRMLQAQPTLQELPGKIVELLARPRLVDIPENPVAAVATLICGALPDYS